MDIRDQALRLSQALLDDGYCIIENAIPTKLAAALADDLDGQFTSTELSDGPFSGKDTRRFGGLLKRSKHSAALVENTLILEIVDHVLGPWCDRFSLNLTQAIELIPGSIAQVPHRDQDMWPCSHFIPPEQRMEFLVNVMWPLTSFTHANGATQLWPGSHRRLSEPLIDPEEAVVAVMEPGSALLFLGSTLHAGGANRTQFPRRGVIISYCLGWLKPYELPWLAYPPDIARNFSSSLAALAGYKVHRPNLGTYEGRCPSLLLAGQGKASGAIDMLLPEQEEFIAAYRAGRISVDPIADAAE